MKGLNGLFFLLGLLLALLLVPIQSYAWSNIATYTFGTSRTGFECRINGTSIGALFAGTAANGSPYVAMSDGLPIDCRDYYNGEWRSWTYKSITSTGRGYRVSSSGTSGGVQYELSYYGATSCSDGVLNADETGVDCGGAVCSACAPSEPENCSSGVQDGDELGLDCGGSCLADCVWKCPTGFTQVENMCLDQDDTYGLEVWGCPSGYVTDPTLEATCSRETGLVLAAPDSEVDPLTFADPVYTPSTTLTSSLSTSSTVDNGDGTSTKTTITDIAGPGGSSSTTTTTTIINNTTGEIESATVETEETPPWYEDEGNYVWDDPDLTQGASSELEVPEEDNLSDLWSDFLASNPIQSALSGSGITTSTPVCSLSGQVMGHNVEFTMCGDLFVDTFNMMGAILIFVTGIGCYLLVVAGRS
jgi:hypothetical protein